MTPQPINWQEHSNGTMNTNELIETLRSAITTWRLLSADLKKHTQREDASLEAAASQVERYLDEHTAGWIPCSERLPENDGYVLTCALSPCKTADHFIDVSYYNQVWNCWVNDNENEFAPGSVLAWMPLPEAYKENL